MTDTTEEVMTDAMTEVRINHSGLFSGLKTFTIVLIMNRVLYYSR